MNVAQDLGDDAWRQLGVEALRQGISNYHYLYLTFIYQVSRYLSFYLSPFPSTVTPFSLFVIVSGLMGIYFSPCKS